VQITSATVNIVVPRNNCLVLIHELYHHIYVLGNGQFGFRRVKGSKDANGILRIIR
jgi:hypothetical protein